MSSVDGRQPRVALEPATAAAFIAQVRRLLEDANTQTVVIGLERVDYGDAGVLTALEEAGREGQSRGKTLVLDGVAPELYKALYVAKIAHLFRRERQQS